ncbi:sugar phosphate isomerase/epimerase family protein [Nocardia carnea]|uniref:sugar phosphate isomerase/epimerase family protein n=1 Tax=Nocardia carnea TaxID=37328 RepID=UPI0024568D20|nr:TIM barrel protein [Nocardia carnea]
MSFTQRYTAHLGYAPPTLRPQFLDTVGSSDPVAHIEHAARIGMAGIFDPWVMRRDPGELAEIGHALTDLGLSCGSIVCVPLEQVTAPLWTDRSRAGRAALEGHVRTAATAARTLGSSSLAVLVAADPSRTEEHQRDDAAANLREMSLVAADFGTDLAIEPMIALPNMLLRNIAATTAVVSAADAPGVGILFDTGHVSVTDGDLLAAFEMARGHISSIQIVDMPGRVEPGAGDLALAELLATAVVSGYSGLIDFEHQWSSMSRDGEATGLARLREFDRCVDTAIRARTTSDPNPHYSAHSGEA